MRFVFLLTTVAALDTVAVYWGQGGKNQQSLLEYCQQPYADIFILAFLTDFPSTIQPEIYDNKESCRSIPQDSSETMDCSALGKQIVKCQKLGKKVLLSLGGADGNYGFSSNNEAEDYAYKLYDTYINGVGSPFGDCTLDGFDFDIESGTSTGYATMASTLRIAAAKNKNNIILSAAPQCPWPDPFLGELLLHVPLDMVFVQFYNNDCGYLQENWNWQSWATAEFPKNTSILLGIPGSKGSADSGFLPIKELEETLKSSNHSDVFGGVMIWDAESAFKKTKGKSYIQNVKELLNGHPSTSSLKAASQRTTPSVLALLVVFMFYVSLM